LKDQFVKLLNTAVIIAFGHRSYGHTRNSPGDEIPERDIHCVSQKFPPLNSL